MKTEKFKVIQFVRELILLIDKEMDNFPKKDIEIKNRIRSNSYDVLEILYMANTEEDIFTKRHFLLQVVAKVKVLDFLLNLSYDKQIITSKKYYKFGERIDDITKYTVGWLKKLPKQ